MTHAISTPANSRFSDRNLTDDHVWIDLTNSAQRLDTPLPALFLDRDGVIVVDAHYLGDPDKVELIDGAGQLIGSANEAGIPVIVVTNQSGIGRGYFGWQEFEAVQDRIENLLSQHNARWDAVLACPHHRDAIAPYDVDNHPWRKPNPGMLTAARAIQNINLAGSWVVGDKAGDLLAGKDAGLKGGIHVATHPEKAQEEREKSTALQSDDYDVRTREDLQGLWDLLDF